MRRRIPVSFPRTQQRLPAVVTHRSGAEKDPMRTTCVVGLALLLSLTSLNAAPPAPARKTLKVGVAEGKGKQTATDSFAPFLAQMNKSPTYAFEMVIFEDGEKQYAALRDGRVDLAFLGPAPYVKARYEFKAEPVVA
jgi:ABC-type phosphate/phosphonate transport system substrate-binding protein